MASVLAGMCMAVGVVGLTATVMTAPAGNQAAKPAPTPLPASAPAPVVVAPIPATTPSPAPEPVGASLEACQSALDTFAREEGVHFRRDAWELTPRGRAVIEGLASAVEPCAGLQVEVQGHTDAQGVKAANIRLSRKRAETVRDHLVRLGLSPDRLSAVGFGPDQPIASNRTEAGRSRNRRIAFRVSE
jgi:OOP family OmpA-OmpF porin